MNNTVWSKKLCLAVKEDDAAVHRGQEIVHHDIYPRPVVPEPRELK